MVRGEDSERAWSITQEKHELVATGCDLNSTHTPVHETVTRRFQEVLPQSWRTSGELAAVDSFAGLLEPLLGSSTSIPRQPMLYDSWIVANLQGRKSLFYADRTQHYDTESILGTTSGSPVECKAKATAAKPLIAIVIDVRMDELMSMSARMSKPHRSGLQLPRVVDVFPFTAQLRDVYGRLLRALHEPSELPSARYQPGWTLANSRIARQDSPFQHSFGHHSG